MLTIAKFGGSSLATSKQFEKVKKIILDHPDRRVVVVSALGVSKGEDNKITDLLYLLHAHLKYGVQYDSIFELIRNRYLKIKDELKLAYDVNQAFDILKKTLNKQTPIDDLVSRGEYFSAQLLAEYIGYSFVDAKDVVKFKYDSQIDYEASEKLFNEALETYSRVVVPGFYGSYPNGSIHLLPRGGSDLTGSISARVLHADLYENWTDVSGILMADPRIVKNPKRITEITYRELRELSYMGANVIHEDSILPLEEIGIPICILNTNEPADGGTLIKKDCEEKSSIITGIAGKKDFSAFTITKNNHAGKLKVIQEVLNIFDIFNIVIEHIPSSMDSFSVIVETKQLENKYYNVMNHLHKVDGIINIEVVNEISLVSIVGRNMSTRPGIAGQLFSSLGENKINIILIAQSSQEINIVIGVKNSDFEKTIQTIYTSFVE